MTSKERSELLEIAQAARSAKLNLQAAIEAAGGGSVKPFLVKAVGVYERIEKRINNMCQNKGG